MNILHPYPVFSDETGQPDAYRRPDYWMVLLDTRGKRHTIRRQDIDVIAVLLKQGWRESKAGGK